MISREEIEAGLDKAKELMADIGLDSDVTYEDFVGWFESEVPVPDVTIGEVVIDPLLVVHELAEIHEVLMMGLELSKEVLASNRDKVDTAHRKATATDLIVARSINAIEHIGRRANELEKSCANKTLPENVRAEYRRLLALTKQSLSDLEKKRLPSPPRSR
jgi:type IV secretory pathway protease TraF